jgi:hypothetical protein
MRLLHKKGIETIQYCSNPSKEEIKFGFGAYIIKIFQYTIVLIKMV